MMRICSCAPVGRESGRGCIVSLSYWLMYLYSFVSNHPHNNWELTFDILKFGVRICPNLSSCRDVHVHWHTCLSFLSEAHTQASIATATLFAIKSIFLKWLHHLEWLQVIFHLQSPGKTYKAWSHQFPGLPDKWDNANELFHCQVSSGDCRSCHICKAWGNQKFGSKVHSFGLGMRNALQAALHSRQQFCLPFLKDCGTLDES